MKRIMFLMLTFVLLSISAASFAEYVNGYTRSDGTYVQGYNRSSSNSTVRDNYSYEGNTNPYTGTTGHNHYRNNRTSEYYDYGNSSNSTNGYNRQRKGLWVQE